MAVSVSAPTVAGPLSGTVIDCRALTRWRSRAGSTCSSLASARTEVSSMPATLPLRGGAQPDGDGDRLLVVEQQRRQVVPGAEPVPGQPGGGVHRVAELAQPVHVAADGAAGHAEPLGELGAGPVALGLQQGQQRSSRAEVSNMSASMPLT